MRVVQVVLGSAGGIGTHVRDLVTGVGDLGHDVRVLTDAATQSRFRYPGAHVDLTAVQARRLLAGADVVHAHGYRAGLRAVLLAPRDVPVVISLHNQVRGSRQSPRRVVGAAVARAVLRSADLVTGASQDLVADAVAMGAHHAEIAPVPSPRVAALLEVDRDAWRAEHRTRVLVERGLDPARALVLGIARVAPQKRIDQLVRASGLTGADGPQWALLGPGQDDLASLPGGSGSLHLLGEGQVDDWLLAADVFVLTSEWEARALVVQEAMAAGTPVVATRSGGLPDLLDEVGVLVAPEPLETLAQRVAGAVEGLLEDPSGARSLARSARGRAAGWDGIDDTAGRWTSRYERLASMT